MKKILWVSDAACPSGFARAAHEILQEVDYRVAGKFDVTVLGVNYRGDPHSYPYPIYSAGAGGDAMGVLRLIWMCDLVKPDCIVIQSDGWQIPPYVSQLKRFPEYADVPIIVIVAIDGKNFNGKWLGGVTLAVFWTEFALAEARSGGYAGPAAVIPLGVDVEAFQPMDKAEARRSKGLTQFDGAFIVGNVNRNQSRKRFDLTIKYFAEWIKSRSVKDAWLFLHAAPTGDTRIDVPGLMRYYGVVDRLMYMTPETFYGVSEEEMRATYCCFDVQMTTTQGEGFGLTTFEGSACGIAQIGPRWSALEELMDGAARLVRCSSTAVGEPYVNVIGGVADEGAFVSALDEMYRYPTQRQIVAEACRARAFEPRFRWKGIGEAYAELLGEVLGADESKASEPQARKTLKFERTEVTA